MQQVELKPVPAWRTDHYSRFVRVSRCIYAFAPIQPIKVEVTNLGQVIQSRKLRCQNGLLFTII